MEKTEFRILETLSRGPGAGLSIYELTKQIKQKYKTGDYKNIYGKIQALKESGGIQLDEIGGSSISKLNFNNYLITDYLAQTENEQKKQFLSRYPEFIQIFEELEQDINSNFSDTETILILNAEQNARLNKIELMFILRPQYHFTEILGSGKNATITEFSAEKLEEILENEKPKMYEMISYFKIKYNIKPNAIILKRKEFEQFLQSEDENLIKQFLTNKIAIFGESQFWKTIRQQIKKGTTLKPFKTIDPAKISEEELTSNLERFGYSEMGKSATTQKKIDLETIITAILIQNKARQIEIIPTILEKAFQKNEAKPNYSTLIFLAQKYNKLEKLYGLLEAYNSLKPRDDTSLALQSIKALGAKPAKADTKTIKQKMRLYNAI